MINELDEIHTHQKRFFFDQNSVFRTYLPPPIKAIIF